MTKSLRLNNSIFAKGNIILGREKSDNAFVRLLITDIYEENGVSYFEVLDIDNSIAHKDSPFTKGKFHETFFVDTLIENNEK